MSKKSGKGKNFNIERVYEEREDNVIVNPIDLSYLTDAILDYYTTTGAPVLEDGEEWKSGTDFAPKSSVNIPQELDNEIKKAFIAQIKKFQK